MPPIKIYRFKHKVSNNIKPIEIHIYENLEKAWKILSNYVLEVEDWVYIK